MNKFINALIISRNQIERVMRMICLICGAGLLILLTGNVLNRLIPVVSLHWFGEIVELLFAWMVFLGAAVLYSRKEHFMIDWLAQKTEGTRIGPVYRILINIVSLIFVATLLVEGFRLTMLAHDWTSVLHLPRRMFYLSMPIAGLSMVYTSLIELLEACTAGRD